MYFYVHISASGERGAFPKLEETKDNGRKREHVKPRVWVDGSRMYLTRVPVIPFAAIKGLDGELSRMGGKREKSAGKAVNGRIH